MIKEVDDISYIQDILKKEFHISYNKSMFSKEFVYIDENQCVGFIIYSLIYDRIELDYIFVNEKFRNKGIASKLMLWMIDNMSNDIKNITLEVNVNNIEAISLYKKYGFSVVAIRPGYYNGTDGYLMIRG